MAEHPLAWLSSTTAHEAYEAYGIRGALPSAIKTLTARS